MTEFSAKRQILASFENARRVALAMSEAANVNTAVSQTGDPTRPYQVSLADPYNPQQILRVQKG